MQTRRYLVVGESGSGKTVLASELIEAHRERGAYRYLVVVSSDTATESALAPHCAAAVEITDDLAEADLDLAGLIEDHGSIYFEVSTTDAKALGSFLDQLGAAVLDLGDALVVVDEAAETTTKAGRGFLAIWSRGRKRGVIAIAISQGMKQRASFGVHPHVVNRSDVVVAFHLADPLEVDQVARRVPAARDVLPTLATPLDGEPEYLVADTKLGQTVVYRRSGRVAA